MSVKFKATFVLPTTIATLCTTSFIMYGTGIRLSLQREFQFLEERAAHFLVIRYGIFVFPFVVCHFIFIQCYSAHSRHLCMLVFSLRLWWNIDGGKYDTTALVRRGIINQNV